MSRNSRSLDFMSRDQMRPYCRNRAAKNMSARVVSEQVSLIPRLERSYG